MAEHLIPTDEFCTHYNVEYSFISSLQEYGLIEVTTINETSFIDEEHLVNLEKLIRLHYDLEINLEGIETITYLLNRIRTMQEEIMTLRNRLDMYE